VDRAIGLGVVYGFTKIASCCDNDDTVIPEMAEKGLDANDLDHAYEQL
jgi:hypothetical protein